MKNIPAICIAFSSIIFFLLACKKNDLKTSDETATVLYSCTSHQTEPYICFDSLLEDSRCPEDVECVWQGTALIKVSFHETGNTHHFIMSLKGFPPIGNPSDTTINGYNIVFTKLDPYPNINNPEQKQPTAYFNITP